MRFLLVELEGAEVRRSSGEAVVDRGQNQASVNSFGVRLETEVQIHRVVDVVAAGGVRRRQVFEDVVIDLDAMGLLTGRFLKLSECGKTPPFGIRRLVRCLAGGGRDPVVLAADVAVGAEAVIVAAVVARGIGPGHDAAVWRVAAHKQVIAKICTDLRVKRLDVVGSAARDDFQPERSDIDVLVEFEGVDRLFDRYFELKIRLEHQLGRQVDVIQDSAVRNPYVRKNLDQDRVRIYGS